MSILLIEWLILFVGLPVFTFLDIVFVNKFIIFTVPFIYSLILFYFYRPKPLPVHPEFRVISIFKKMLFFVPLMFVFVLVHSPEQMFNFPRQKPELWTLVMVLYPLLSVFPQEFIYRKFYFWRYKRLFSSSRWMIFSSAFVFSFLHIVYDNWVAIVATLAGGFLFSLTYDRSGQVKWAWLEHTIYGQLVFTVGLGHYFYEAPVAM